MERLLKTKRIEACFFFSEDVCSKLFGRFRVWRKYEQILPDIVNQLSKWRKLNFHIPKKCWICHHLNWRIQNMNHQGKLNFHINKVQISKSRFEHPQKNAGHLVLGGPFSSWSQGNLITLARMMMKWSWPSPKRPSKRTLHEVSSTCSFFEKFHEKLNRTLPTDP